MKPGAGQGSPLRVAPLYRAILRRTLFLVWGSGVVRLERRILDIVDTSPSEMMLASLEPETLLAWCCAFFGMAQGRLWGGVAPAWVCPLLAVLHQFFGMLGGQGLRRTSFSTCLWCPFFGGGGGGGGAV